MKRKPRVGIIGTGNVCRHAHIPAYAALEQVELTALYDKDQAAAHAAREHYNLIVSHRDHSNDEQDQVNKPEPVVYGSAEELIRNVDIVDICTSLRYHAFYSALALRNGVNVMTEKPMARTWWEARHVADLADRSSVLFQFNDDNPFIPRYLRMRNLIESGYVGNVQSIRIVRGRASSGRSPWFFDGMESGGGALFDYGSHAVASTWFLIGYDKVPELVRSQRISVRERTRMVEDRMQSIEVDDDAHFKVLFRNPENGDWTNVSIEATWAEPELAEDGSDVQGYVDIQGDEGSIRTAKDQSGQDCLAVSNPFFGERQLPVRQARSEADSFQAEIMNFLQSIQCNTRSVLNARIGEGTIRVLNMAQLSELNGRCAVTPEELESYCTEVARDTADPWEAGDRIARELTRPYRLGQSQTPAHAL